MAVAVCVAENPYSRTPPAAEVESEGELEYA